MTGENDHEKELKTVKKLYAALCVTLLAAFIPSTIAAIAVGFLFIGVLIAAYSIRGKAAKDGIAANHMTYIIRSVWISSFVGAVTTAIASIYVLTYYDPAPIQNCMGSIMESAENINSCLSDFVSVNKTTFIIGTITAAIPVALYSLWRLYVGGKAALKSTPVKNPQAWV